MDRLTEPRQVERVLCFDAETGRSIWKKEYACKYRDVSYETGPRASVTIDEGRAYALGTMGHMHCLDARTGEVIWKHDLNAEYRIQMPIWGISGAPLVEGEVLIVMIGGEDGACVVGFDKRTGKELWRGLDDQATYAAPIVLDQAGRRVVVVWTGEHIAGLDPTTGEVLWTHPYEHRRMIIAIATPVVHDDLLFFSGFFDGSLLLRLRQDELGVEQVWLVKGADERHTKALHSIISTPIILDGFIYGICSYGQLRCLDLKTGRRVWESNRVMPLARWATAHLVPQGDKVWIFNERGDLIISQLSPEGYKEISRAHLIDPTMGQLPRRGGVCWTHPAFAGRRVYVRNDETLVCADLSAKRSD